MSDQFGDKTHAPTPQRRQEAREEGRVARSQDLVSAAMMLGGLVLLLFCGGSLVEFFEGLARAQWGGDAWLRADADFAVHQWRVVSGRLVAVLLPMLGTFLALAVLTNVGQSGFLFLPRKLAWDLGRISPWQGLSRLASPSNAVYLVLGVGKIAVVLAVTGGCLWAERERILTLTRLETAGIAASLVQMTLWTGIKVSAVLLAFAILDYAWQRWRHEQELRMTTQEVREEAKSLQGDPQVAAQRRELQRRMVPQPLAVTVPTATVVISAVGQCAVAVRYDAATMDAPKVVAKGTQQVACRIRELAEERQIPLVEQPTLAHALLDQVEPGAPMPAAHYRPLAEILRRLQRPSDDSS